MEPVHIAEGEAVVLCFPHAARPAGRGREVKLADKRRRIGPDRRARLQRIRSGSRCQVRSEVVALSHRAAGHHVELKRAGTMVY